MKLLPIIWASILGAVGFAAGFFGPLIFSPEANQGPLLGIFITGPGGALAGLVLGFVVAFLPALAAVRHYLLGIACILVGGGALYWSMPEPKNLGRIIDAEISGCAATTALVPSAIADQERQIATVTWATPRAGWKEEVEQFARTDPGVVLEMRVLRERSIYENRKPWNRGTLQAGPWVSQGETRRFYARFGGKDCSGYAGISRALYFPVTEEVKSTEWPSKAPLTLFGLQVLGPVPEPFRKLLN